MENHTTYSLANENKDSGLFYQQLTEFTDLVLNEDDYQIDKYINHFKGFLSQTNVEQIRSHDEYKVELLMIGIYWTNYSGNAAKTGILSKKILESLYKQRKKHPALKNKIDRTRGFMAYYLLEKHASIPSTRFTKEGFNSLLKWLTATGEFNEEVIRLKAWTAFFNSRNRIYIEKLLETSLLFAAWFSDKGSRSFGKYLAGLSDFRKTRLPEYKFREDYFLAGRRENEYLLNIFAAEVLNRSLKSGFSATKKKVLLLPTCMRTESKTDCKAKSDGKELVCTNCSKSCNIGKVSAEMNKQGITTYLIPHSSDFSRFLAKWKDCPDTSLIGVACILNLITGGYEMKRLNISSQCIFLDYCGCQKHWDKTGVATSLDVKQLSKLVQEPIIRTEPVLQAIAY